MTRTSFIDEKWESMKKIAIFTLALAAISSHAAEFTYKGLAIGSPATDIAAKLPDYKRSLGTDRLYRYDFGGCARAGGGASSAYERCRVDNSFAGGVVDTGDLYLKDGLIMSIDLNVQQVFLDKVIAAVTEAYGKPTVDNSPTLQNGYGAKLQGRYIEWDAEQTQLALTSSGRETFRLVIRSQEEVKRASQQNKDGAAKAAKDF